MIGTDIRGTCGGSVRGGGGVDLWGDGGGCGEGLGFGRCMGMASGTMSLGCGGGGVGVGGGLLFCWWGWLFVCGEKRIRWLANGL